MHHYSHHIGDYRRDTMHLTLLEHGVYRQLLDMYYLSEKPITLETQTVFRGLCARTQDEQNTVELILKEFFTLTENGWVHARCDRELSIYHAKCERNREVGKQGGRPKKTQTVISDNHDGFKMKPKKTLTNNQEPITNISTSLRSVDKAHTKKVFDPDIDADLLAAWKDVRKAKKAGAINEIVWKAVLRESGKAGITPADAVRVCVERGWQSFKADWYKPVAQGGFKGVADKQRDMANEMFGGLVNGSRRYEHIPEAGSEGDRQAVSLLSDDLRQKVV